jgi:hypothetical protein
MLVCGRRAASCRFGSLAPGITIQQGVCKRSFAKVANCWRARKHAGGAGRGSMGMALSMHNSGPIKMRFTAVSG